MTVNGYGCVFGVMRMYWGNMSFPGCSDSKESACSVADPGSIPGLGRSPERKEQSTPAFLPGEFHGQRSLAGYSPGGRKASDTTE